MTPEAIKAIVIAALAALLVTAGWTANGWRKNVEIERIERVHADQRARDAVAAADEIAAAQHAATPWRPASPPPKPPATPRTRRPSMRYGKSLPASLACLALLSACSTVPPASLPCPRPPASLLAPMPPLPPIPTSPSGPPTPDAATTPVAVDSTR